jgi:putative SOS response-associated peptidase YedK
MCFTVNVNLVKEELENRYGATLIDPDKYRPSYYYNAFSLPHLPALCSGMPLKLRLLQWGLIPSWTRTTDDANIIRFKTFNARAETLEQKPSFSGSFRSARCIIPVKGFFEWQHDGKEKIPWYISHFEDEIISFAGLYNDWTETSTGEIFSTFSIVTTDANDLMAGIHNSGKRMPVILDKPSQETWMNSSLALSEIREVLKPCPSMLLKAHTVGPLVNDRSSDRNTPEVIRPFHYNKGNVLF